MGLDIHDDLNIDAKIAKWYFGNYFKNSSIVGIYFYSLKPILVSIAYKDQVQIAYFKIILNVIILINNHRLNEVLKILTQCLNDRRF